MTTFSDDSPDFRHREHFKISGHLNPLGSPTLTINGSWKMTLGPSEFIVWIALACHGLAVKGIDVPVPFKDPPSFPSAKDYLETISKFLKPFKYRPAKFDAVDPEQLAKKILLMRAKLVKNGFAKGLLLTGPGNRGYRLDIPPENIWLHLVHPDTGEVWDIRGGP